MDCVDLEKTVCDDLEFVDHSVFILLLWLTATFDTSTVGLNKHSQVTQPQRTYR